MSVVLGLDAAWTTTQPSGVALVTEQAGDWSLRAVAGSYADFYCQAGLGGKVEFDAQAMLAAAAALAGRPVDLVAADIPLAHTPIAGRRESDNAVSRLYGSRHAGTHSPSALRPGALADAMRAGFAAAGYPLLTRVPALTGLIEVYPHPALIELMAAPRRLPYKMGKTTKYWPGVTRLERRHNLLTVWRAIVERLEADVSGVTALLPLPGADATGRALKTYEDKLDAVVCAWVGICAITGSAMALGDEDSVIWVPMAGPPSA